jgi:hypothetical protein
MPRAGVRVVPMRYPRIYYFPGNYVWSSAFTLALMAGGQLNQMDRWLAPLRDIGPEPDTNAWTRAWDSMGQEQSRHAAQERTDGYVEAASARYFRAATYHLTGERQTRPDPAKIRSYTARHVLRLTMPARARTWAGRAATSGVEPAAAASIAG